MQDLSAILKKQAAFFYEEADLNVEFRLKALDKLAVACKKHEEAIQKALKKDLGKSTYESFITETGYVQQEITFVRKRLKKWAGVQKVKTPQKYLFRSVSRVEPVPRGQVLIYAPWNYPFQLLMSPLIGAIAAGNTVVLKPSEHAPATAGLLEDIITDIFPGKYIAVVNGDEEVARQLSELDWDMIFYTGSTAIGRQIYEKAASHLTPVVLELGGKCPVIVHRDANLQVAARRIIWGKILNAGQTCIAPDYILVHQSVKGRLLKLMCREITQMLGESPKDSAAYARIVNPVHFERLKKLMEHTQIYCGGQTDLEALYIAPTIIDNVEPSHPLMQEEIFGPLLPVMTFEEQEEAIRYVNRQFPPLAIYAFTGSRGAFDAIRRHTRSGAILKNETILHVSNLHLPFGGVRQSGIGRYHGKYSFDAFSELRTIFSHSGRFDSSFRYPPYTEKKWKVIRKVFR